MKTIFDVIRQPLVIGALVLSIFIVVGVYFGSHWYYGDVEPVEMLDFSARTPTLPKNLSSSEVDLSGLQGELLPPQTESTSTISSVDGESVNDFLAELSDEEKALLTAEVGGGTSAGFALWFWSISPSAFRFSPRSHLGRSGYV